MFKLDKLSNLVKKTMNDVDKQMDKLITPRNRYKDFTNAWQQFNRTLDLWFANTETTVFDSGKVLGELTKLLQKMITILADEESKDLDNMGQCLEFIQTERVCFHLLGLAKGNNPNGLLKLSLKFMISLLATVKRQNLLVQSDTHQAIFQLLQFLHQSLV